VRNLCGLSLIVFDTEKYFIFPLIVLLFSSSRNSVVELTVDSLTSSLNVISTSCFGDTFTLLLGGVIDVMLKVELVVTVFMLIFTQVVFISLL